MYLFCLCLCYFSCSFLTFFFYKQKTSYEMRISDGSSDVCSSDLIIKGMVGRDMAHRYPPRDDVAIGEPLLEVEGWTVRHPIHAQRIVVEDISLTVRRGEVVGIAGLLGAGRTEFAMSQIGRASCRERVCQYV